MEIYSGNRREDAIVTSSMYLSSDPNVQHHSYTNSIVPTFGGWWSDPYNPHTTPPQSLLYICEPSGTTYYPYPVNFYRVQTWFDNDFPTGNNSLFKKCSKGVNLRGGVNIGGGAIRYNNIFPFEYNDPVTTFNFATFTIPDIAGYRIDAISTKSTIVRYETSEFSIFKLQLYFQENITKSIDATCKLDV
ncbi:MAG: hypothetical protein IPJ26_17380 [Bacteroidetes bacterium]|nr:hypothetical protein [Bacteroidota bacterium]